MFRARPGRFSILILAALAGIVGAGYFLSQPKAGNNQYAYGTVCLIAGLAALALLAIWKIHTLGSSIAVTTKRTLAYRGFFGKYSNEVRHEDVRNIQISQTFLNRLLKVGDIDISSSGLEGIEITAKDIPDPYRLRDAIDEHRKM